MLSMTSRNNWDTYDMVQWSSRKQDYCRLTVRQTIRSRSLRSVRIRIRMSPGRRTERMASGLTAAVSAVFCFVVLRLVLALGRRNFLSSAQDRESSGRAIDMVVIIQGRR